MRFHPDATTQRHLGQRIQGLDDAKWNAEKRGHMKDILLAKFSQIANLKKLLINTNNKSPAEANARDNYFGIGLPLTHKDVLDPRKWHKDGNQLGTILMEIRQELIIIIIIIMRIFIHTRSTQILITTVYT